MANRVTLPSSDGNMISYTLRNAAPFETAAQPFKSRVAFAAAHVVCDPIGEGIDWQKTLDYRRYLWSLGLAVAEAMDTAQRGMGLDWEASKLLIRKSLEEAKSVGGKIACGAGTDHLDPGPGVTPDDVAKAYLQQCEFVESGGGQVILMASRALAACAKGPQDYKTLYDRVLSQVEKPVILHWLGDMFDPQLTGYWGYRDPNAAMEVCLEIIHRHAGKVDGIKISLLDEQMEVKMRRKMPKGVRMYTGDDFNYPALIRGDEHGYSDALLGIFDAIAPAASAAIRALDEGNASKYDELMEPTVALSRHIFQSPTYYYKAGVVFMAYLNGHQSHFRMVEGVESKRSILHYAELFQLADQAGLLRYPDLAVHRMKLLLALAGVF